MEARPKKNDLEIQKITRYEESRTKAKITPEIPASVQVNGHASTVVNSISINPNVYSCNFQKVIVKTSSVIVLFPF